MISLQANQKLGVLHACLELGNWKSAKALLDMLPPFVGMCSSLVVCGLCRIINYCIDPLYRKLVGLLPELGFTLYFSMNHFMAFWFPPQSRVGLLKYIHIEKILLFLATTLVYLNRTQQVSHHSIANARAVLPASSKKARIASALH